MKTVKATTDNPVMNALLDATLKGEDRRLLHIGETGRKTAIFFTASGVNFLEGQLADARKRVADLELALALSTVGKNLGVEIMEAEDQ
jgi:hypothetical protein